ncbi:glycerophosphodiester phosphodiesterase family protein [Candidatus Eisenbacteria bacterium]|uniref:Glycerophosphodiester phosphodiesterase family protein n=1 Tax=Eiseniibacteriota bacterium TaxID=2212470 RepID=A0ABV6YKR4_UNCEI
MKWTRLLSLLLICTLLTGCSCRVSEESFHVSFDSTAELRDYLAWTEDRVALIAAHRGGPEPGYPENCIDTFENALHYAPCLIECDVRMSKDSVLVMMHDESLDRTTTGSGRVADRTLAELKGLRLKDNEGEVTSYVIPTLSEVLQWAKDRAIVELDVKRPVTPEAIVAIIREHQAEAFTVIITYSTPTALEYHDLNPELIISASARDMEGARYLLASGIDPSNLLAFVGVYEPSDSLYALFHAHGMRAILGTMGNLDQKADKRGYRVYSELIRNGADILATDRVPLASKAIGNHPD